MLDLETRLFVRHDDNSSFVDRDNDSQDYSRDSFGLVLIAAEDYLYFGYRKAVNAVYIEMAIANTNANTFTFEYHKDDGVTPAFTAVPSFSDETKGFTRSGFLVWERNLEDEAKVTIDSQEAFWYRLKPSADHSVGTIMQALSIVFSDDNDLAEKVANISAYLVSGSSSHILSHVAARKTIIQDLRNSGKLKIDPNTGRFKNLNMFDLLDIGQIREASTWKALSIIFDDVSDRPDDKYNQRALKYNSRYKTHLNQLQFLSIDVNDDGRQDINEEQASTTVAILRR